MQMIDAYKHISYKAYNQLQMKHIYIYSVNLHVYRLLLAMVIAVNVLTFTSDIV